VVGNAELHPKAKGKSYDDLSHTSGQTAAKTTVNTFICPSVPNGPVRDPISGYGGFDYMFIALSDVNSTVGDPLYGQRQSGGPTGVPWKREVVEGCLNCADKGFERVTDGTSKTILCIEDASRSHPSVPLYGAYSSRPQLVGSSGQADAVEGRNGANVVNNARRVFAWADPDAVTNGYSGPNGATAPASKLAAINQNSIPVGGPTTCTWQTNNCGPNDEPFAFHQGGANMVMGDGAVKFLAETIDGIAVKWLVGAADGVPTPEF
jgi:prepilin-type processing-associated H-X9-DG protein